MFSIPAGENWYYLAQLVGTSGIGFGVGECVSFLHDSVDFYPKLLFLFLFQPLTQESMTSEEEVTDFLKKGEENIKAQEKKLISEHK